jgi:hypothetical protein
MKPRLRYWQGVWWCGEPDASIMWWTCSETPAGAYQLWQWCRSA